MKIEIKMSEDGSTTMYNSLIDETYHSIHGALQESKHVFIAAGLIPLIANSAQLNILEIGFGSGLNALLTYQIALENNLLINYTGIEKFPIPLSIVSGINYGELLSLQNEFNHLHEAEFEQNTAISNHFSLVKHQQDIATITVPNDTFHLVYFDAFSPEKQPELWTTEVFQKMYDAMKEDGILVTYCAKGQVRRNLEAVGFRMERIPGPPGKREMLRGTKILKKILNPK